MPKIKRPHNLDKRVIFCDEFAKRIAYIHRNQLLHLRISYNGHKKFKWTFEFDIWDSGDVNSQIDVTFTKDECIQIINIFESKPFDWRFRYFPQSYPLFIYYHYLNLEDVVEVANKVTDYVYSLYNNVEKKPSTDNPYQLRSEEKSNDKEWGIRICNYVKEKYELCFSQKTPEVSILLFNNGRMITKNGKTDKFDLMFILKTHNYSRQQAIEEYNPDRKDGILLIFYEQRKAEFYEMEWNEFCLMMDKRVFYKTNPDDDIFANITAHEDETDDLTEVNLFPDEIKETESKETFKEGTTSKILVNSYERNPKARQKCIEFYGTTCYICGFDFAEKFGAIGEGFINVHHLKPLSEIGEEYIIDPIKDMRPVCPNCHAMIHRRTPAFTIKEIQQILRNEE